MNADTHPVTPSFQTTNDGVRFNVQSVDCLGGLLRVKTQAKTKKLVESYAKFYYEDAKLREPENSERGSFDFRSNSSKVQRIKIEAHSLPFGKLIDETPRSLVDIALFAFANHYPLSLRPDDLWIAISHGAATHIEHNAEELRSRFVSFQGTKEIEYRNDSLELGHVPKHVWELDVFPFFSGEIRKHIGEKTHTVFVPEFSTTLLTDRAASELTLMSGMKKYFRYQLCTKCGIPWIELKGILQDWLKLRQKTEALQDMLLPEFAERWLRPLLQVLDEFINAFKGNVNHTFWQRMAKKVDLGRGSGRSTSISGWINTFYPYLQNGRVNTTIKFWNEMNERNGPEPHEFPSLLSSAPVSWIYLGQTYKLHFHAGYFGMAQDPESLSLEPHIGWMITHDP